MSNAVLKLNDIHHSFTQGKHKLEVLKGINLEIKQGEMVALLGPSGCGKSTLLQIAGLLEKPNSGEIIINDIVNNKKQSDKIRTALRSKNIGFIYQFHYLLSDFTALENLLIPQYIAGVKKKAATEKAMELLARVGLEDRATHYPSQLSGGEQQRVAIARALVNNPSILLADEPTGNLDPKTAKEVFEIMRKTIKDSNAGALIVTHDYELASNMDRILKLKDGVIEV